MRVGAGTKVTSIWVEGGMYVNNGLVRVWVGSGEDRRRGGGEENGTIFTVESVRKGQKGVSSENG